MSVVLRDRRPSVWLLMRHTLCLTAKIRDKAIEQWLFAGDASEAL